MSERSFTLIETVLAAALLAATSVMVAELMRAVRLNAQSSARTQSTICPDSPRPRGIGTTPRLPAWFDQLRRANVDAQPIQLGEDGSARGLVAVSRPSWLSERAGRAGSLESRWVLVETADAIVARWYAGDMPAGPAGAGNP